MPWYIQPNFYRAALGLVMALCFCGWLVPVSIVPELISIATVQRQVFLSHFGWLVPLTVISTATSSARSVPLTLCAPFPPDLYRCLMQTTVSVTCKRSAASRVIPEAS